VDGSGFTSESPISVGAPRVISSNLFLRAKRPQELKHKTDAQHTSMIILQQIWPEDYDELYGEIEDVIIQPRNCMESFNDNSNNDQGVTSHI
jgi:hypothetical protein